MIIGGRAAALLALGACALAFASVAHAQRSADYGRPEQTPENMASMALRGSSGCALRKASATVDKLLATGLASPEEAKFVKSLKGVARECYPPNWPPFGATAVRNTIAEMVYREHYRSAPKPQPAGASLPASFAVVSPGTSGTPEQEAAWYLGALARCVVFADGAGVHQLITGPANVPEEEKRFAALAPSIGRCAPPETAAKLGARLFRGYLANALLEARKTETAG